MSEPFSHRRHPDTMLVTSAHVKTEALRSVHVSKGAPAVGLLSVAAILSLIMWYIFSFLTLFMNKYTLDALQAEPFLFCEYHVITLLTYYFLTFCLPHMGCGAVLRHDLFVDSGAI